MAQLYLLSVVANVVAGLTLLSDRLGERVSFLAGFEWLRRSRTAEITLGLATAVIGVLKLIIKSPGEGIAVAGDLLPAVAGIGLGLILLGEAFRQRVEIASEVAGKASRTAITYRVPVGIVAVVIAILHFLIPGVLFL